MLVQVTGVDVEVVPVPVVPVPVVPVPVVPVPVVPVPVVAVPGSPSEETPAVVDAPVAVERACDLPPGPQPRRDAVARRTKIPDLARMRGLRPPAVQSG